jgi:hypothetical protein
MHTYSLTENLSAAIVIHGSTDFFLCGIGFNDLVLTFQPLLVFLSVLLFYRLIALNSLHEFGFDQPRLKKERINPSEPGAWLVNRVPAAS